MIEESLTIILPLPTKILSPNCPIFTPKMRFAKAASAKRFKRLTKESVDAAEIETKPWTKVDVKATFFHKIKRKRDTDNAIGSLKHIYDGIPAAGLVPDDTPEHMKRNEPEFKIDKINPRLELTLTRIR